MGRISVNIDYIKQIDDIIEFLKYSDVKDKSLKTYLLAFDKFFPYLVDLFKENHEELKNFKLEEYDALNTAESNKVKQGWVKADLHNRIFDDWKALNPNQKASILMKFVEAYDKNDNLGNGDTTKNTYLNYVWRIQGLLSKMGRGFEANPKNMKKIKSNGFHLTADITFDDVQELYDKLNNPKYKVLLKILMYTGLNPADIVKLKPNDFKLYEKTNNNGETTFKIYYILKERQKTAHKGVDFLIFFSTSFMEEIKDYFERKIVVKYKIDEKKAKIAKLQKDPHFKEVESGSENYIQFEGNFDWVKDGKKNLFGNIKPQAITDNLKYHAHINNLNPQLMPAQIRRLCFTRLMDAFSLRDRDIYDVWTQHKVGVIEKHYLLNLVDRAIPYFEKGKVEESVLLGNVGHYIKEVNGLRNGMQRIGELETENKELKDRLSKLEENWKLVMDKLLKK